VAIAEPGPRRRTRSGGRIGASPESLQAFTPVASQGNEIGVVIDGFEVINCP
jgi:hypothetical protein